MRRTLLTAVLLVLTAVPAARAAYTNPVLPGDRPDPTVMRAGGAFYASATVSAWAPLFPILRSRDLVNWEQVGGALPTAPRWAAGKFWAPELVRAPRGQRGFLLYYSASRVDRKPCIGVASAPVPEGPYRDRGPAACPPGGAIDAAPVTDGLGRPWLGWKALGSGNGIYLQRLRRDGLRTTGHAYPTVKPDQPWERGVTEGASFVRDPAGGWLMLYAGGTCCRPPCTYAESSARAPSLRGPWVKAPAPFLTGGADAAFKCPGHGTVADLGAAGLWLLHHGYRPDDDADLRRVGLLTRVAIGADGWPAPTRPQAQGDAPLGGDQAAARPSWTEPFTGTALQPVWQWLFDRPPALRVARGALRMGCAGRAAAPSFVARQAVVDSFTAVSQVRRERHAVPFLAVHDHAGDLRGMAWTAGGVRWVRITGAGRVMLGPVAAVPPHTPAVQLLVTSATGGGVGLQWRAAGTGAAALQPQPAGAAAEGAGATRVAVGCWGHGTASFGDVRLRAAAGY